MPELHLTQLRFDTQALIAAVDAHPQEDGGYIVHRALEGLFQGGAPGPFRVIEHQGIVEVLAYSERDADALNERAELTQNPALWRSLLPGALLSKPMPRFEPGRCLGFELRACPVVRTQSQGQRRERDAYLRALDVGEVPSREEVYVQWLRGQLSEKGASLMDAQLEGFRLMRIFRQSQDKRRKARTLTRPDALLTGRLVIEDPEVFAQLLRRGVGRHRSFGFGMLQLRPC